MIALAWMGLILVAFLVGLVVGIVVAIVGIENERRFEEEGRYGRTHG